MKENNYTSIWIKIYFVKKLNFVFNSNFSCLQGMKFKVKL